MKHKKRLDSAPQSFEDSCVGSAQQDRYSERSRNAGETARSHDDITFEELIDVRQLQELLELHFALTRIPVTILNLERRQLAAVGLQDICTKFHGVHPVAKERCAQNNEILTAFLHQKPYAEYRCQNGLWDVAVPIFIENEHVATLVIGQFLYEEEPFDLAFFERQAQEFGFDAEAYLTALHQAPIFSRVRMQQIVAYYLSFVHLLSDMGYTNLKLRRDIEQRVQAERERDRFFNRSLDMLCVAGFDGMFKAVNPAWTTTLGWRADELMARPYQDFVHPDDQERTQKMGKLLATGQTVIGFENRYRCRDGSYRWIAWNSFPLPDEQLIFAVARDSTARKAAEVALRDSEQRFRSLFHAMTEGVAIHHLVYDDQQRPIDYVIDDVNPAFERQTGLAAEQTKGRRATAAYDMDAPPFFDTYRQVAESGAPVAFDVYFPPLKKHFHISVFSPEPGKFATVFEDITERKLSEQALQESEARFRSIIENTQAGYFFIDAAGYFRNVNAAWLKLYKYDSAEDVIGRHFTVVQKIEDIEQSAEFVAGIMRGDSNYSIGEFSRKCHDGTIEYHSFSASPVWHGGEAIGIEGFILDTTARRRAEEEILRLNAELEERVLQRTSELEAAIQELKDFAHIVSHDLKAPLRNINQLSHWLVEDYGQSFDAEGQKLIALLIGTANHMDNLINGILEYSRIGRVRNAPEEIDLNLLVAQIIRTLSVPAQITITVTSSLPKVIADRTRLTQVFQNLLENAIKFMNKTNGLVAVTYDDTPYLWQFCVEDNGPGIAPNYHEKIFQLFQTLGANPDRKSTGIGLSLVKKIIEFYGGRVWIESEVGRGSKFLFTLPKSLENSPVMP